MSASKHTAEDVSRAAPADAPRPRRSSKAMATLMALAMLGCAPVDRGDSR